MYPVIKVQPIPPNVVSSPVWHDLHWVTMADLHINWLLNLWSLQSEGTVLSWSQQCYKHERCAVGLKLKGVQPAQSMGRTERSQSTRSHADRPVFNIRLKISPGVAFAQII